MIPYVTNKEVLAELNTNSLDNLFITLNNNLKTEMLKSFMENISLESIYTLIKFINNNTDLKDYLLYGIISDNLHDTLNNLLNNLYPDDNNNDESFLELIKEENMKILNSIDTVKEFSIKLRLTGLIIYIEKGLQQNPLYKVPGNNYENNVYCFVSALRDLNNKIQIGE